MIILGIDPGTAITGYAVLNVDFGNSTPEILEVSAIKTSKNLNMPQRLKVLHDDLFDVVNKFSPELMVIERLFFNTNVKTAMSVGQARGVPLLIAAHKKMTVFEYTALEAKSVVTGYGRASKQQMQDAVRDYLGLNEIVKPDDANDAIAMVLCFLNKDYTSHITNNNEYNYGN